MLTDNCFAAKHIMKEIIINQHYLTLRDLG
jgi:hypothetical protein